MIGEGRIVGRLMVEGMIFIVKEFLFRLIYAKSSKILKSTKFTYTLILTLKIIKKLSNNNQFPNK